MTHIHKFRCIVIVNIIHCSPIHSKWCVYSVIKYFWSMYISPGYSSPYVHVHILIHQMRQPVTIFFSSFFSPPVKFQIKALLFLLTHFEKFRCIIIVNAIRSRPKMLSYGYAFSYEMCPNFHCIFVLCHLYFTPAFTVLYFTEWSFIIHKTSIPISLEIQILFGIPTSGI